MRARSGAEVSWPDQPQAGRHGGAADLTNLDRIDLHQIHADVTTGGDQAFTVVTRVNHQAGELTMKYSAKFDATIVKFDIDGDGVADGSIKIHGDHSDFTNLVL